jgi:hypothetical protein
MDMFFNFVWERIVARILCGEEGEQPAKPRSCLVSQVSVELQIYKEIV